MNGLNLQIAIFILTYKIAHKFNKDAIFVEMGGEETMAEILIYNPKFSKTISDLRLNNFNDQNFRQKIIFEISCDIWKKSQSLIFSDPTLIEYLDNFPNTDHVEVQGHSTYPVACLPLAQIYENLFKNIYLLHNDEFLKKLNIVHNSPSKHGISA